MSTSDVDQLTREDLTTIAKSLHRTGKDLERSQRNAERRGIPELMEQIDVKLRDNDRLKRKINQLTSSPGLQAGVEGFTP